MNYIVLSILLIVLINKNLEIISLFFTIIILLLFFCIKKTESQLLLETNIAYNSNIELAYIISNIAINSVFFIQLIYIIIILNNYRKLSILNKQITKYNIFFLESIMFYSLYLYNTYYIIKKEHLFLLHENIMSLIHPILTLTTFISFFLYIKKNYYKKNIIKSYYLLLISIMLGTYWALTTEGWGGAWVWDPTEIILFFLLLLFLIILHFPKNWYVNLFFPYWIIFNMLCYTFINKINLISGIHNFYLSESTKSTLFIYIIFLIITILGITVLKNNYWIKYFFFNNYLTNLTILVICIFLFSNINMINTIMLYSFFVLNLLMYIIFIIVCIIDIQLINKINFSMFIVFHAITIVLLFYKKIIIIIICYVIFIIYNTYTENKWIKQNHTISFIITILIIINYIEYKYLSFSFFSNVINSIELQDTFNHFSFQKSKWNNNILIKNYIYKNNFLFFENTIPNNFSFEQKKNIVYQISTNLFSIILNNISMTFENNSIKSFNFLKLNLFMNNLILLVFWVLIVSYLKKKW